MGIRYVGETVAKTLARNLGSIDAIIDASKEELVAIDEIGEKIADEIILHFSDPNQLAIVQGLKDAGLQMQIKATEEPVSDTLKEKSLVISGTFSRYSRDEIKELIEKNGGKNVSGISAKTDYLVAGDKIGPSKLSKAQKLGIKIISENEFLTLIDLH